MRKPCRWNKWGVAVQVQPSYVVTSSPWGSRRRMTLRRRLSDATTAAYGAVTANARRPSIRTDLMIVKAKQTSSPSSRLHRSVDLTSGNDSPAPSRHSKAASESDVKRASKCNIQWTNSPTLDCRPACRIRHIWTHLFANQADTDIWHAQLCSHVRPSITGRNSCAVLYSSIVCERANGSTCAPQRLIRLLVWLSDTQQQHLSNEMCQSSTARASQWRLTTCVYIIDILTIRWRLSTVNSQ